MGMETNGPSNEHPQISWDSFPEGQNVPSIPPGTDEIQEPPEAQEHPILKPFIGFDDVQRYTQSDSGQATGRATAIVKGLREAGVGSEFGLFVHPDELYDAVRNWAVDSPIGLRGLSPENVELLARILNDRFPDRPPLRVAYLPPIEGSTPDSIEGTTYPTIDRAWIEGQEEPTALVSNRSAYWWARDHGSTVPRTQYGKLFGRLGELSTPTFELERPENPTASTMVNEYTAYIGAYPSRDTRQYNNPIWGMSPEKFTELMEDPDMIRRYDTKRSLARYERALSDEGMMQEYAAEVERVQRELRGE